jgi:hypothetical protein
VQDVVVRLVGRQGDAIELTIAGYQFPDAEDPRERFSWHMVVGRAACPRGVWEFRYPALTSDESTRISPWLRRVAAASELPALTFVEPNLSFALVELGTGSAATIEVGLDLEFRPPWDASNRAGNPFVLSLHVGADQIMEAAADWAAQVALYPDG